MATTEALLTAEEYARLPDAGRPTELVRGKVVMMNAPGFDHCWICNRIGQLLASFVYLHRLGHVLNNDSGVVTQRSPDTVRGADVAFYSYQRVPKGPRPKVYPGIAPELVFEVLSPDDRPRKVVEKVAEYLHAGVLCVCVVDPKRRTVVTHHPDGPERTLTADENLEFPAVLPGFSCPARHLFELESEGEEP
ncbi:MAG: Uma2 family endonuclease [Pirellulales bacterium]